MDIQALFNAMSESNRRSRQNYHLTLGGAIEALKAVAPETLTSPSLGHVHSYRGYYSDLALEEEASPVNAADLLRDLEAALDQTFEGYKGGDFIMGSDTPLWMASYSCCGSAIVGVNMVGDVLTFATKEVD